MNNSHGGGDGDGPIHGIVQCPDHAFLTSAQDGSYMCQTVGYFGGKDVSSDAVTYVPDDDHMMYMMDDSHSNGKGNGNGNGNGNGKKHKHPYIVGKKKPMSALSKSNMSNLYAAPVSSQVDDQLTDLPAVTGMNETIFWVVVIILIVLTIGGSILFYVWGKRAGASSSSDGDGDSSK